VQRRISPCYMPFRVCSFASGMSRLLWHNCSDSRVLLPLRILRLLLLPLFSNNLPSRYNHRRHRSSDRCPHTPLCKARLPSRPSGRFCLPRSLRRSSRRARFNPPRPLQNVSRNGFRVVATQWASIPHWSLHLCIPLPRMLLPGQVRLHLRIASDIPYPCRSGRIGALPLYPQGVSSLAWCYGW